ncbi:MAG: hypothetical protein NC089_01450 [Bacteroides sp.]|nr:hypothetical protein [Bacteroides sp.]MCM1548788.1 hypothetical protein [Clostridium sp.]
MLAWIFDECREVFTLLELWQGNYAAQAEIGVQITEKEKPSGRDLYYDK